MQSACTITNYHNVHLLSIVAHRGPEDFKYRVKGFFFLPQKGETLVKSIKEQASEVVWLELLKMWGACCFWRSWQPLLTDTSMRHLGRPGMTQCPCNPSLGQQVGCREKCWQSLEISPSDSTKLSQTLPVTAPQHTLEAQAGARIASCALGVFTGNTSTKPRTLLDFKEFGGNSFKGCQRQWFQDVSASFGGRVAPLCSV